MMPAMISTTSKGEASVLVNATPRRRAKANAVVQLIRSPRANSVAAMREIAPPKIATKARSGIATAAVDHASCLTAAMGA